MFNVFREILRIFDYITKHQNKDRFFDFERAYSVSAMVLAVEIEHQLKRLKNLRRVEMPIEGNPWEKHFAHRNFNRFELSGKIFASVRAGDLCLHSDWYFLTKFKTVARYERQVNPFDLETWLYSTALDHEAARNSTSDLQAPITILGLPECEIEEEKIITEGLYRLKDAFKSKSGEVEIELRLHPRSDSNSEINSSKVEPLVHAMDRCQIVAGRGSFSLMQARIQGKLVIFIAPFGLPDPSVPLDLINDETTIFFDCSTGSLKMANGEDYFRCVM